MPDDLYDRDALIWSEQQSELLRRLARGERVNGIDWAHVVEEIEDVGLSELHSVESYIDLMLTHLLKVHGWPASAAGNHWRTEIATYQRNMTRRFAPSMRQRIDLGKLYQDALDGLEGDKYDDQPPHPWPASCPFTLDQLLTERPAGLEERLSKAAAQG